MKHSEMITAKTAVYSNKTESVTVDMVSECLAANLVGHACIRKIVGGGFACISTLKPRLWRKFTRLDLARSYLAMISAE